MVGVTNFITGNPNYKSSIMRFRCKLNSHVVLEDYFSKLNSVLLTVLISHQ